MVGEVPGVLWSPVSGSDHAPVVLMGHGGGQHKKTPALMARAHHTVTTWGFTVVAIETRPLISTGRPWLLLWPPNSVAV
jgi:poly(3-hydroxybutyrate) depolymerase